MYVHSGSQCAHLHRDSRVPANVKLIEFPYFNFDARAETVSYVKATERRRAFQAVVDDNDYNYLLEKSI